MPFVYPKPGDDLLRIAASHGVQGKAIRSSPENRDLFASREPGVLFSEDEIWVPEPEPHRVRVRVGETVYLVYRPPLRTLHLALRDESGAPKEVDYTLQGFEHDGSQREELPGPL